jgi:hypothetical protein
MKYNEPITTGVVDLTVKWRRKKWQQFYGRQTNCAIMWGVLRYLSFILYIMFLQSYRQKIASKN